MPASFEISHRSSKTEEQKIPQSIFRTRQVVLRIHRPQNVVPGHLPVKGSHQIPEASFPYHLIQILFFDFFNAHPSIIYPESAPHPANG